MHQLFKVKNEKWMFRDFEEDVYAGRERFIMLEMEWLS